ncbi:MAG: heavy-metal-associated domain-containing protein [Saprospiraceae bacterium]|nr:heavy-metal-associated domain-containing protein [Saprospiraceae bacterium]
MKFALFLFGLVFSLSACSQKSAAPAATTLQKTDTFIVSGNCGMCKKTIETSATSVKGVSKAVWDINSHQLTVTYDPVKASVDQIQQKIAAAGYDNAGHRGNDAAYAKLPACCHYERKN